ncbi:MAG: response regulator [Desulfobacteraceae bacterium]|nr:response regulator [Desulfobacteraceae bacterium]
MERASVLIVDDERYNINLLADILKSDYRILVAKNGEEALEVAMSDDMPDMILLDIMMPGMDGYEVCRRLKADMKTRDIPIIFVTAMTEMEDEAKGLDIGAIDYIVKPVSLPIVKARVRNHVLLKQASDRLKQINEELREALTRIKTLEGLLPICANCKKIRKQETDPQHQESWLHLENISAIIAMPALLTDYAPNVPKHYTRKYSSGGREKNR